ncbi:MAG: hypothetical protein ACFWT2_08885 [Thermoanaerobacterium thermosaccharolyticum]|jgi:hypothetical protein
MKIGVPKEFPTYFDIVYEDQLLFKYINLLN